MKTTEINSQAIGTRSNDYGFVGVQYLAEKFKRSSEEILMLFIECEYSIRRTVETLEQKSKLAA